MEYVIPTAAAIALATVLGTVLGERVSMLGGVWSGILRIVGLLLVCTIVVGVLLPAGGSSGNFWVIALLLCLMAVAEIAGNRRLGGKSRRMGNVVTVLVIALHHFPEGMAAGISCTQGGISCVMVCGAAALHLVPETMVILPAMREAGFSDTWAYTAAAVSGAMEIAGLLAGYWL